MCRSLWILSIFAMSHADRSRSPLRTMPWITVRIDNLVLHMDGQQRCSDVKMEIERKTSIPVAQQKIMWYDNEVTDSTIIATSSSYRLILRQPVKVCLGNDMGVVYFAPSDTVNYIMDQVSRSHLREFMTIGRYAFFHNNQRMAEGTLITDHNIQPDSCIMMEYLGP